MNWTSPAWIVVGVFSLGLALQASATMAEPKLVWEADGFAGPESVVLDDGAGVLYLSNVNGNPTEANGKGYISKLSLKGEILEEKWVSGLNAPKGLGLRNGTLYAADINQVAEIDIETGKVLNTHEAPGAAFLHDVAVHKDGRVFISDMLENQIWVLEDGTLSLWLDSSALDHPNGLLAEDGRLVVASWGKPNNDFSTEVPGTLVAVDYKTKNVTKIGKEPVGNLDGVEPDGKGGFLVTDWFNGGLYRFAPDGRSKKLLDLNKGSADLLVTDGGTLAIIPMMLDNKVSAYKVQ